VDSTVLNKPLDVAPCDEIYDTGYDKNLFGGKTWLCANVTEFEVLNNPFFDSSGKGFFGVVNFCSSIDPLNKNCKDREDKNKTDSYLQRVFVKTKTI